MIVLSDNFRPREDSIYSGDGPLSASTKGSIGESSKEDGQGNFENLDMRDVDILLSSSTRSHIDPDVVIAT